MITGAGALTRDEGDGGHSRIPWAIRGMYDNKAHFLPFWFLQICSGFVSMKKLMFQYVARGKCLLIYIRAEYIFESTSFLKQISL